MKNNPDLDKLYLVYAGKFRRYHYEGIKQIFDVMTILKNIRDLFLIIIGTFQSFLIIKKTKPGILFTRGGYLSVPVALAAKINHVPYITHDSDSIPSLTNKIIARWAKINAVSIDSKYLRYPETKKVKIGVPVSSEFVPVSQDLKNAYRKTLSIPVDSKMILVIGGGLGSVTINEAFLEFVQKLLEDIPDVRIYHIVGIKNLKKMTKKYQEIVGSDDRIKVMDFIDGVYQYSGAADLIISRAGATNLAEFSIQAKPCIIIPSPYLTGGHQLKNAEFLEEKNAAVVLQEDQIIEKSNILLDKIVKLLNDDEYRKSLSENIAKIAVFGATERLADLILSNASEK